MIIKIHQFDSFSIKVDLSNIKIMKNEDLSRHGVKLYEFVKEFDALITDYSSIYCDYMILDRPMAFTIDDMESYSHNRGFVFDNPLDYMPGQKLKTMNDIVDFVDNCLNGQDPFRAERERLQPIFNKYRDGNNCKRILDEFGITL